MEIALGVISVTDVAVRCCSKLWALSNAWRDAPADIHHLRDDLTSTERFFGDIQEHVQAVELKSRPYKRETWEDSSVQQPELRRLVDDGLGVLNEIETIVDGLLACGSSTNAEQPLLGERTAEVGKRTKLLWLRQLRKVARLRKELAHVRSAICRLLISQNIFLTTEIQTFLEHSQEEVSLQLSALSMSIEASHSATLAQLGDQLQSMEHRILTTVQKSPDAGQKPGPLKQKELCFSSGPRRGSRCDINCTCQCHDDAKFSWKMNMALFQSVVGIAAVAYSSWGSRRCTNPSCRESDSPGNQRPVRDIQVVYHLPDWLSRVSVSLFVSNNLNGSPQMQLRVYNRRAWGDGWNSGGLLRLIDGGDVEGIKAAFRNSQATVYDLYGPGCATPLWAAFQTNDIELVSILLQAGADPFYRLDPPNGRSVMDLAFQISNTTIPEYVALASLFPVSRYIEDLDIPNIHLAVIKNAHSLLSSSLQKTTASINQPITPNEYAPLHLAAMRGDVTAVRLLIRYGATLDVPTKLGVPPLYFASLYGNHSVVSALLLTGADPNQPDNLGRRPLHGAATARTNSAKIMSLLLQHGADINARMPGIDPFTPLSMAISYGDVESTEFLFSRGADPEQGCAMSFNFPMQVAIERGDCAKAELLLKHGAEVNAVGERDGTGLLHHLAMSGTEGLMRLFMVPRNLERLRGVKTALKDGAGKTPMVLFDERVEKAEGLRKGFEALLDAVEGLDRELVEDEEEDVFFDAVSGDGLGDVTG